MDTNYRHVPSSSNLLINKLDNQIEFDDENLDDYLDQIVNGDYKSLSRVNSLNTNNDFELKEINSNNNNNNNNNKLITKRRNRTNSFNSNIEKDYKGSIIKLFRSNNKKQKLSPSSSINLHSTSTTTTTNQTTKQTNLTFRNRSKPKKRSYSHSYTTNSNANKENDDDENQIIEDQDLDDEDEQDDDDDDDQNDEDENITKKPLLNRSNSKPAKEKKLIMSNHNSHEPDLIKSSTCSTDSTKTYTNSSESSTTSSLSQSTNSTLPLNTINLKFNDVIMLDENNNKNDNLNVIILEGSNVANSNLKRIDSIRMRHNSNLIQQNASHINNTHNDLNTNKLVKHNKSLKLNKSQKAQNYLVITILFVVNLLNYIDRYTLAGVLTEIQKHFGINDGQSGLLQTVFICSYMLLAPLFGYLGDRYSRKWIIIFGISFWSMMTFLGSFIPSDKFWLFAIIRSLVGIGEASYSCVAPTIIGDLFTNELRTRMLAIFYLAVPVGSGMGYIVGSNVAKAFGNWQWSLRVTPPLGLVCIILLIIFVREPKRGGAEGSIIDNNKTTLTKDIIYLLKNKTFMWITLGFTFASFVLGGLSWWVPTYVQYAIYSKDEIPEQIPLIFGVVTCLAGLTGVVASSFITAKLRTITKHADPLVCALGSLIAVPTLFILVLITRDSNQVLFWMIAAIAISGMCLSWTLVADILLYAVYPNRRSIASAMNILISHLLGDAGSPYVIGAISDALRSGKPDTFFNKYSSLQTALYTGPFFAAFSFAAYLIAAIYIEEDKKKVDDYIKKNQKIDDKLNSSNESNINEMNSSGNDLNQSSNAQTNLVINKQNSVTTTTLVPNTFSNPLLVNEMNSNFQETGQVQIKPGSNQIHLLNNSSEIPILFDSSANLLQNSIQSTINN